MHTHARSSIHQYLEHIIDVILLGDLNARARRYSVRCIRTGSCRDNVSAHPLLHHNPRNVLATFYIIIAVFLAPISRELNYFYA